MDKGSRIAQWCSLVTCLLMLVSAAILRDGKLAGLSLTESGEHRADSTDVSSVRTVGDTLIVNTTEIGRDITGYAGQVPLEVYVADGRVMRIEALPNNESPAFFNKATRLLTAWNGLTLGEALRKEVDAVSGATFSSQAIIIGTQTALRYIDKNNIETSAKRWTPSAGYIVTVITILLALIVPLFHNGKRWHRLQLVLNVVVLGLWSGTFLSYAALIGIFAGGINSWILLPTVLLIIAAFIFPLFGKKGYYCAHVCPFGSAQELCGIPVRRKWKMSQRTVRWLTTLRQALWVLLMLLMLSGTWFGWVDYELFVAFIFTSAPVALILLAVSFLLLSVFVPRPYCRFVCPTGTLLKISQNLK